MSGFNVQVLWTFGETALIWVPTRHRPARISLKTAHMIRKISMGAVSGTSTMSVTVVVTNYLRLANVQRLIDVLYKQTVTPTIFVWDNSPTQDFNDPRVSWLIRSSKNAYCVPRWWMAIHAETDFVLVHDDDLMPLHPKVLAWTLEAAAKIAPFAVGATGVILKRHLGYWQSQHVGLRSMRIRHDVRVDIVKGCYFCCPTQRLTKVGHLDLDTEDDIAVSAKLGNGLEQPHQILSKLQNCFELLPEGEEARQRRPNHRTARDAARWQFFR